MSGLIGDNHCNNTQRLLEELQRNKGIAESIVPPGNLLGNLLGRIQSNSNMLADEALWTFLLTFGYTVAGGEQAMFKVLTEGSLSRSPKVLIEAQPIPPRQGRFGESEGNSNIDLLIGDFSGRPGTASGVCASAKQPGEVCFVEAKLLSDIAHMTSRDLHRNQLVRVIENALTFQDWKGGKQVFPDRVHVTLLTPKQFKTPQSGNGSRFYYYKFDEYSSDTQRILSDIGACSVDKRCKPEQWEYPIIGNRVGCLALHWVTHEDLFRAMPWSDYREILISCLVSLQQQKSPTSRIFSSDFK